MKSRKALGAVIATSLLIVVAVITLVLFNSWFQSYSSNLMADVETQSSINAIPEIENVIGDFVYIKTPSNLTIDRLLVDGNECETNVSMTQRMQGVNISSCLSGLSSSTPKITLITDNNIVTESVYLKDVVVGSSELTQIPGNTSNKIYDSYNGLYWVRNLSLIGQQGWSVANNATYSEPTWNETTGTYSWPNGLNENGYPAFRECLNLDLDGYTDWRIPTRQEISNLGNQEIGGWGSTNFLAHGFVGYNSFFWSLDEYNSAHAWYIRFTDGFPRSYNDGYGKNYGLYVVCVRS